MVVNGSTTDVYIKTGIKVLVNPDNEYFEQLQEWISETERWNYRRDEYRLWRKAFDDFWLYLAIDEENDEVICSVSLALQYTSSGERLYSIGNYYCVPDWRGKGISNQLFKMVMKIAGTHNTVLYGATQMSDLYASRFNFSIMNDFWHNFAEIDGCNLVVPQVTPAGYFAKKIEEHDWQKLLDYDSKVCGFDRKKFMKMNLTLPHTISRLVVDSAGRIVGFGAIKVIYANEIMISPLYAENFDAALTLVVAMLRSIPKLTSFDSLVMIYPDANNDVPRLLSIISNDQFESHQAYRVQFTKNMMDFPQHKVYANDECSHSPV